MAGETGERLGGLLLTSDVAEGEALAMACRAYGVELTVRRPSECTPVVAGDLLVLDLQGQSDEVPLALGSAVVEAGRVVAIGTATGSLNGTQVAAWVDPGSGLDDLGAALAGADSHAPVPTAERLDGLEMLTGREREVLAELVEGRGVSEMSERMEISANTVRTHLQNVFAKLGVASRAEAAAVAVRHGLRPAGDRLEAST
jgi:DNA-binding CsgD family transcriptional regulator